MESAPGSAANPYAPPRAAVRDIRPAGAAIELAERSTRLGAAIVDGLIFIVMVYVPTLLFTGVSVFAEDSPPAEFGSSFMLGILAGLIGLAVFLWLTIRQLSATGQSLGNKYCNIKVVRSDGTPVTLGRLIWLRNVVNWLLGIVPLYGLIDVLLIFGEPRQCVHDKLADTIVVKA
jgi:uncharacterized RDD family membrane protein YckC